MMKKLKQFVGAKRGVSPVIGVVLMVAVVVILAAVIGAFVLGLGGDQQTTPQASFSYDSASTTLTMSGGDQLDGTKVYIVEDGTRRGSAVGGTLSAGSSLGSSIGASDTLAVVYDDGNGNTATLWNTKL